MIIRMTVRDNDFTDILERFANNLLERIYYVPPMPETSNPIEWYETIVKPQIEIQKISDNDTPFTSRDDLLLLTVKIKMVWHDFVQTLNRPSETKIYLDKHFEVDIRNKYEDCWENGEVVYYFTNAQKWISQ